MKPERCPGSGQAADWTAGKVRCPVCRVWVWGQLIGHNLGWTPPHESGSDRIIGLRA